MSRPGKFSKAFPYQEDVLSLPVKNLDITTSWYSKHFGMVEVERTNSPVLAVIMERDGVKLGFAINGRDSSQDGAAILVENIEAIKAEFESNGVSVSNAKSEERDGNKFSVFFVVAPDGLCYYIHEPTNESA